MNYTDVIVTPSRQDGAVAERWNPWRVLRSRPHIRFELDRLPAGVDAVYARRGDRAAIVVDEHLPRPERAAALAHELVHDELGDRFAVDGMPAAWDAVVAAEEARIDREVARRVVDRDELAEFVDGRTAIGEAVFARDVADWFDVAEWVAQRALEQLRDRRTVA